jgi:hypothetical protein
MLIDLQLYNKSFVIVPGFTCRVCAASRYPNPLPQYSIISPATHPPTGFYVTIQSGVSYMIEVQHFLAARNKLGEGPLWHPGEKALYWVDI